MQKAAPGCKISSSCIAIGCTRHAAVVLESGHGPAETATKGSSFLEPRCSQAFGFKLLNLSLDCLAFHQPWPN